MTNQKLAEPKLEIKQRVGKSPDISDGAVLCFAYEVIDKLPENELEFEDHGINKIGAMAMSMPEHEVDYGEEDDLYD